jgi:hypothetical protein
MIRQLDEEEMLLCWDLSDKIIDSFLEQNYMHQIAYGACLIAAWKFHMKLHLKECHWMENMRTLGAHLYESYSDNDG